MAQSKLQVRSVVLSLTLFVSATAAHAFEIQGSSRGSTAAITRNTISEVAEVAATYFTLPSKIVLSIEDHPLGSSYSFEDNLLVLASERYGCNVRQKLLNGRLYQRAVAVHEFGHAVFFETLLKGFKSRSHDHNLNRYLDLVATTRRFKAEIDPQILYFMQLYLKAGDSAFIDEVKRLEKLPDSLAYRSFREEDRELLSAVSHLVRTYDELFADLFSVIWSGKKELLAAALASKGGCLPVPFRSFSSHSFDLKTWDTASSWQTDYEHNFFAPVRWTLGNLISSTDSFPERFALFAPLLHRIVDEATDLVINRLEEVIDYSVLPGEKNVESLYTFLGMIPSDLNSNLMNRINF